jgi:hypothetical protein
MTPSKSKIAKMQAHILSDVPPPSHRPVIASNNNYFAPTSGDLGASKGLWIYNSFILRKGGNLVVLQKVLS